MNSIAVLSADDATHARRLFAPIVVTNNHTRHRLNRDQALRFAQVHDTTVYAWPHALTSSTKSLSSPALREQWRAEFPDLTLFFVAGAPASLGTGVNVALGLTTNAACHLHSFVSNVAEDLDRLRRLAGQQRRRDGVPLPVKLVYTPQAVNVVMPTPADGVVPECSLFPDKFVVSITNSPKVHNVTGTKKRLRFRALAVDLAFAVSDYKAQGDTLPFCTLDLNWNTAMRWQTPGVYVAVSRCASMDGLRLLAPITDESMPKLTALKHDPPFIARWYARTYGLV